jgi:hypothetical protein
LINSLFFFVSKPPIRSFSFDITLDPITKQIIP